MFPMVYIFLFLVILNFEFGKLLYIVLSLKKEDLGLTLCIFLGYCCLYVGCGGEF